MPCVLLHCSQDSPAVRPLLGVLQCSRRGVNSGGASVVETDSDDGFVVVGLTPRRRSNQRSRSASAASARLMTQPAMWLFALLEIHDQAPVRLLAGSWITGHR